MRGICEGGKKIYRPLKRWEELPFKLDRTEKDFFKIDYGIDKNGERKKGYNQEKKAHE